MADLLLAVMGYLTGQNNNGPKRLAPAPSAPRLTDEWNICVDANSIYARWIYPPIETIGELGTMINRAGASHANTAIPGQSWDDMRARATDIDSAFKSGKKNVLITSETTNQVFNLGSSVPVTVTTARAYLAERKAANRWDYVIFAGTIPRADAPTEAQNIDYNARMVAVDKALRDDESLYDVWVDLREAAPRWFSLREDGYTAHFMDSPTTCNQFAGAKETDKIHPIGEAREAIASALADGVRQVLEKDRKKKK